MIKNTQRVGFFDRSPETCQWLFNLIVFSLPIFLVAWLPGLWVCFFCILILYNRHFNRNTYFNALKNYYKFGYFRYVFYGYSAYFVLSAISIVFFNSPLKSIDNALIFLMWLLVSPIMVLLKPNSYMLGFGCVAAAIIAFFIAIIQFHFLNIDRPYGLYGTGFPGSGAIKFADISLLIGVMAYILFSGKKYRRLGFLGVFLGIVICLYAGVRGGVVALFLCWVVWSVAFKIKKITMKPILVALSFVVIVFFILNILTANHISSRISETLAELSSFNNDNYNTSMGARLQMWRAALIIFSQHPMLGVGLNNFDDALLLLYKEHIISKWIIVYSHAHNEYFCSLASGGIVGFIITCSLLFMPLTEFKKNYYENVWARCGFWCVFLMAFFALTDCIFDRRMTVMGFIIFISIFMAGNISDGYVKTASKMCKP
ncbi:O-antigen ligase family protein [Crenothrix polyspora]|uniref:O-antigen ligase-related domain-containing protein n=1 Tax=Crenothrix polyspora TaxID=360316 RepID=A0A1R4HBY7_9GAMM|nr:O-antigen ligase family protein [Crenothrix polyspora]SJM93696.1 membrane hypothetical protein [Crenothrix polyspora]